ncbi:hypothetical protein EON81_21260 [bacterium]|nr:MAG: hypothetical protein EON81_21260 [bacterium]
MDDRILSMKPMRQWARWADRFLAVAMGGCMAVGFLMMGTKNPALLDMMAIGLLPSVLLWIQNSYAKVALSFIALPYMGVSYIFCESTSHPSNVIWHPMHNGLLVLIPYGLVRAFLPRT